MAFQGLGEGHNDREGKLVSALDTAQSNVVHSGGLLARGRQQAFLQLLALKRSNFGASLALQGRGMLRLKPRYAAVLC